MNSSRPPDYQIPPSTTRGSEGPAADSTSESGIDMKKDIRLSVVVPVLNERESVEPLTEQVLSQLDQQSGLCELIFVNDGSTDGTAQVLDRLATKHERVFVTHLRRNFGKAAALTTGFEHARGDIVLTMDGDLQDDPSEMPRLVSKVEEGVHLVSGWKRQREDPWHKTIPSKLFNSVTSAVSGLQLHDHNSGFKAYRREVLDQLEVVGEMHRFITIMAHWEGFKVVEIPVRHHRRRSGKSKFGTSRFLKGAFDLITVLLTTRYHLRPLHLFGLVGAVFSTTGIGILGYLTLLWFQDYRPIGTRPLFFLGILLILVGVQLVSTGLLGELIVRQPLKRRNHSPQR